MGARGSSNRNIEYKCSLCHREVGRENLVIKRTQFLEVNGKLLKTRVIGWLCTIPNGDNPSCAELDPAFSLPPRATTPGMKDTKLAHATG